MRILIVSNRLPFTAEVSDGKLQFQRSSGGLVSGLSSYLDSIDRSGNDQHIWVAWPGSTIPEKWKKPLTERALSEYKSYPVFLSESAMDKFYHGFCNRTIWPLFHYFSTFCIYEEEHWQIYKTVNQTFADAVLQIAKPDDVIWVHDYHLMLLPRLLRERLPEAKIGFFLHIPFPSFEIYRMLPARWRNQILEGMLGADLIGFHTPSYTQYFLRSVLRVLGYEHSVGQISLKDRIVAADTFPLGIDYKKYNEAAKNPEIQDESRKLKEGLADRIVILSLDRQDYTKGIVNRLQGYEVFLERNLEWRNKVVLVLIVVPSRIGVEHYQQMKKQIDEQVGKINGKFGNLGWAPIIYQYRSITFEELVAVYHASDVALVTPLRDGMNLIAKEYLACRTDKTGVLVLSEMAGASHELGEALIINPNNRDEIASMLLEALEMPVEEQIRRNEIMQRRLQRYTVTRWASEFLNKLHSIKEMQNRSTTNMLTETMKQRLFEDYSLANSRLILLDYDGTLVPFGIQPREARPDPDLIRLLQDLSSRPENDLVLITGRDRATLDSWFGSLERVSVVAEHGMFLREGLTEWIKPSQFGSDWKTQIFPILEMFVDRVPGAFIEEKEFSLAWHYRKSDPELSSITAKELMDYLMNFAANMNLQVLPSKKVVEVRNAGLNKATAAVHWLAKKEYDFILAIGDDWTDEDVFRGLPESAYTIRVGLGQSLAKFNVRSYQQVRDLLLQLVGNRTAVSTG